VGDFEVAIGEIVAGTLSANTGASAGGATIAYSFFCLDFWDCLEDFLYG